MKKMTLNLKAKVGILGEVLEQGNHFAVLQLAQILRLHLLNQRVNISDIRITPRVRVKS